jgi:hypothetical protein
MHLDVQENIALSSRGLLRRSGYISCCRHQAIAQVCLFFAKIGRQKALRQQRGLPSARDHQMGRQGIGEFVGRESRWKNRDFQGFVWGLFAIFISPRFRRHIWQQDDLARHDEIRAFVGEEALAEMGTVRLDYHAVWESTSATAIHQQLRSFNSFGRAIFQRKKCFLSVAATAGSCYWQTRTRLLLKRE